MSRIVAIAALALAAACGLAPEAAGAARLDYRGAALTPRQAESLVQPALRAPGDSAALAQALADVVDRLQELGHLDARARARWEGGRAPRLVLETLDGPRYRLGPIAIVAGASEDSARLAAALDLHPGDRAAPGAVGASIERALRQVVDHGYPYAELGVSGWQQDSGAVALRLAGALGPRVTVTRARVEGLRVTRAALAQRALGRVSGVPYDHDAALAARDRLAQLGLFRTVSFEGLEGEGDWSAAQLVYRVEEPRYNRFEGAFGVQGRGGAVGVAGLELGNLLGTGRGLGLDWQARGHGLTNFGARYVEPLALGTPLRAEAALDQQVYDTLYVRTRWGGRLQFLLSAAEKLEAGYQQERVVESQGLVEEASLQNTVFALERTTLDPQGPPRRGSKVALSATQSFKRERLRSGGRRTARASAAEAHGEWTHALGPASGLGLELSAAGRFSSQRVLPLYERYPLGGAATLRGHDEEEFRVDRYALSRLEWRWFLGRTQRAFLFWDHAWMGTREALADGSDRLDVLERDGVGFGLRLEAAGGLIGIDYGLEPGRPPLEGKIHLRLVSTF
ncbi:MAG TPA: BamA/TamA family outer membrane protein [Candidatus Eisenbacteria bacterium]|jgi:outer membrane protein assembly factor BamA